MKIKIYQVTNFLFDYEIPSEELLDGIEIFIGRSQDCHIIIDDQLVSRHHAVLFVDKDKVYIKKLAEFGEVFVNSTKLSQELELGSNDRINISDYTLEVLDLNKNEFAKIDQDKTELIDSPIVDSEVFEKEDTSIEMAEAIDEVTNELNEVEQEEEFSETQDFLNDDSQVLEENKYEEESTFDSSDDFQSQQDSDEMGFNDDFGSVDNGFDDDSSDKTQVFQSFASYSLKIFGEHAPFDYFKIEENEIFIGRDSEKCQIILNDPEVSSVHAKIHKSLINCVIEDLNSSNGTILNGNRINKSEIVNGDEFVIGETTFTVQIDSDLLESEKDILMPVATNQEIEVVEEVEEEVDFDELHEDNFPENQSVESKSIIAKIMKDPKKRIIFFGLIILVVFLYLQEMEQNSTPKLTENNVEKKKELEKKESDKTQKQLKKLSPEVLEKLEQLYALALSKYEDGKYDEAKFSLDEIKSIDPNFKDIQTLLKLVNQGYEEVERLKKEEEAEKERQKRNLEIKKLVEKAKDAVEKREVQVSQNYFSQILQMDPENLDVPQLKMIIDAYVKEKEEKRLAEEAKVAKRLKMVEQLKPGKTLYLNEDWYNAIGQLEKFIKIEGIDEDLISEATEMLKTSRVRLSAMINPLLGQARSFKEGQDLKRAFETFGEILKIDPSNEEALIERQDIKDVLDLRSRKVYREALISESLSLFDEAREKFQEVQQISPIGSEYYIKASAKLKNYLE